MDYLLWETFFLLFFLSFFRLGEREKAIPQTHSQNASLHLASQLYTPGLDLICEVQTSISFLFLSHRDGHLSRFFSPLHIYSTSKQAYQDFIFSFHLPPSQCVYDIRLFYSIELVIVLSPRPQGSQHNWHAFSMLIRLNPGHRSSMAIYSDMVKFKTCVIHTHFHWP
jgi:hypothetical protein